MIVRNLKATVIPRTGIEQMATADQRIGSMATAVPKTMTNLTTVIVLKTERSLRIETGLTITMNLIAAAILMIMIGLMAAAVILKIERS